MVDTPPEEEFDRLVGLASRLFDVPIVLVSLLERERQFFKAYIGLDTCETSRDVSFCAHAIMHDDIMVVLDAALDPRFSRNPLVIGPPFIRFYAGKPLSAPNGAKLGTLCIIDTEPRREFSPEDRKNLTDLALLVMDRMEMRRLTYARSISQSRFENIAATSPDAIICSNAEREVTFWNRAAEQLFDYSVAEISKLSTDVLVPDSWRALYQQEVEHLRRGERLELAGRTVELSGLRKDGTEFPAELSLSTWDEGNTTTVGCIVRDLTERRQNEQRLLRLALLDPLTELPNRGAWRARLTEMLNAEQPLSVLLLDLDGFKEVNDTIGHAAGDAVLCEVASRLKSCHEAVMVGRLGGDEFVALLPGNDPHFATAIAKRLGDLIAQPFDFLGRRIDVGVSIGVALAPQHGSKPEDVLGAADLALYKAKAAGRGGYQLFAPSFREVAVARRRFEQELRSAFDEGQFELYYQPQVSTVSGSLTGAEALIRWHHPERGLLAPASFIDVLSKKPSAPAIGEWILRTACQQAAEWRRHHPDFRIGVNVFDVQFQSGRLFTVVKNALSDYALPPQALELEIVESNLLRDDASTLRLLQNLRALGVGLAFDDYGTGYASLSLLKRFPVTRLKIDRSFIRDVDVDPEDAAVVKAIIYLAQNFGLELIAEGVETEAQRTFLAQHGCKESQGYLFGEPVPADEFSKSLLASSSPALRETPGRS
ncbi:MAG: EAL domain-containing protein [Rhodopseudomonas sp.]|uniref:putative bifunctional diguanylate cyclase/phosphodiesterase n=1 Tax=Rhodopseudomonas sp. TaxID=1078 RepID=UPI0039E4A9D8